jgi:hypothetical protein
MSRVRSAPQSRSSSFRTTLVRVLVVQVVALTLLGIVQALYNANVP